MRDRLSESWLIVYMCILAIAALGATVFPLMYSFMVRWWETPMGRYMLYKGIVLACALDLVVMRVFWPELPVWVSFMVLGAIAVMVWWYLILFIRTYHRGKKKRQRDKAQRREDRQRERK